MTLSVKSSVSCDGNLKVSTHISELEILLVSWLMSQRKRNCSISYWLSEEREGIGFFGNHEKPWLFASIINIFKVDSAIIGYYATIYYLALPKSCTLLIPTSPLMQLERILLSHDPHALNLFWSWHINESLNAALFSLPSKTETYLSFAPVLSWSSGWCSFVPSIQ